jgi:hypothetical protein
MAAPQIWRRRRRGAVWLLGTMALPVSVSLLGRGREGGRVGEREWGEGEGVSVSLMREGERGIHVSM